MQFQIQGEAGGLLLTAVFGWSHKTANEAPENCEWATTVTPVVRSRASQCHCQVNP